MKDASQYPITTGYGQIPGYPLNNGFHRGEDRAMPIGTPVIVNGVEIAKSGTNALSGTDGAGPHLHIGRFVNGQATPPNGEGFTLKQPATVYDTDTVGVDPTNGEYVRILDGDGVLWVYLHLSQVEVSKGQLIKGDNMQDQINELNAQLNQTNIYLDELTKRVEKLEAGTQPSDGTYQIKKVG